MTSIERVPGYPENSKLLLIHADDLGLCHSVNSATFDALAAQAISSASLIVPATNFEEALCLAEHHPKIDLGIHWTLTSEWQQCKWGPTLKTLRSTLTDEFGHFRRQFVFSHDKAPEIEAELSAQWQLATRAGLQPTHVDTHMLALLQCPESIAIYTRLARLNGVACFMPEDYAWTAPHAIGKDEILFNRVFSVRPKVPDDSWMDYYLAVLRAVQPGLNQLTVHLGHDDPELRSITGDQRAWGSAWRQRDYDVVMSKEFKDALRANNIRVVSWRELMARKDAVSLQAKSAAECCNASN